MRMEREEKVGGKEKKREKIERNCGDNINF